MKLNVTLEKTTFEHRIIEVDDKFKVCVCHEESPEVFDELLEAVSKATGRPILMAGWVSDEDLAKGMITAAVDVESGETVIEI